MTHNFDFQNRFLLNNRNTQKNLSLQNNLFLHKELLHFSQVMHQIVLPCCVPIENGKWHDGEWCALRQMDKYFFPPSTTISNLRISVVFLSHIPFSHPLILIPQVSNLQRTILFNSERSHFHSVFCIRIIGISYDYAVFARCQIIYNQGLSLNIKIIYNYLFVNVIEILYLCRR